MHSFGFAFVFQRIYIKTGWVLNTNCKFTLSSKCIWWFAYLYDFWTKTNIQYSLRPITGHRQYCKPIKTWKNYMQLAQTYVSKILLVLVLLDWIKRWQTFFTEIMHVVDAKQVTLVQNLFLWSEIEFWIEKLLPLCHSNIQSKAKTKCDSSAHVFPHFA